MSMLEVDIRARFGTFALDAQLVAPTSGIVTVFGRSGAGKTSLVNILAGLTRPTEGVVRLNGEALCDTAAGIFVPPERRRFGYVFQEGRLFPHMTVRGNLLYGARGQPPADRQRRLDHAVALLSLDGLLKRRPSDLSGGEKQRVAIGRALLTQPRMLLMDEPLAALDPGLKGDILPYIERLRDAEGIPIVYVTHTIEEIVRLADTLVLMSEGKVAAVGPVDELMNRLDLRPLTGRYEAGAVLTATVAEHDRTHRLTGLAFPGGTLLVPALEAAVGTQIRLRIRARDVSLALEAPKDISILNVFAGEVREIGPVTDALVDVLVDAGTPIWSRITARSVAQLGLKPGRRVHALVKAVAIDRHSFGGVRDRPLHGEAASGSDQA